MTKRVSKRTAKKPSKSAAPTPDTAKVWSSRFAKGMSQALVAFNASIGFDQRLARDDVAGSRAHGQMLVKVGILSRADGAKLMQALDQVESEIEAGTFEFRTQDEDIHLNIERRLTELTGDLGKRLHTGRSRNDQVALDTRLFTRRAIDDCLDHVEALQKALLAQAKVHVDTILPGYTHLQRAQPVSLGHHLLAYFEMFQRDRERLVEIRRRVNRMPLGSGALAGTTLPLDREMVRKALGFDSITPNSMDAVADRDYVIEFVHAASLIMMHLSRLSEEWILWSSAEFGFLDIDDALCTGSSMMPQKKNPDVPELVRGKTGRVYGHLMGLLTVAKGLPLTYNKDFQEDKEALFDSIDTIQACLHLMRDVVAGTTFNASRMWEAANEPLILATDLAEYLVAKGVPFRSAHEIVGRTVRYCLENNKGLAQMSPAEFRQISEDYDKDVTAILDVKKSVDRRKIPGGTARSNVKQAIKEASVRLKKR